MRLKRCASTFVLWHARAGFKSLCWLAASVGQTMVALATAFKACQRATVVYGPLVILAQIAVLLAWAPTRLLFLALYRAAEGAYHVDAHVRRSAAVAD